MLKGGLDPPYKITVVAMVFLSFISIVVGMLDFTEKHLVSFLVFCYT